MPRRALVPHEGEGCNERAAVPGWSLGRWSSASAPRKRAVRLAVFLPVLFRRYHSSRHASITTRGGAAGGRRAARRRGARARARTLQTRTGAASAYM